MNCHLRVEAALGRNPLTNGTSVAYQYDALNRLDYLDEEHGRTTYTYDDVGNLHSYTHPNGVGSVYHYDALNRLTNVDRSKPGIPIASYAYQVGVSGHRLNPSAVIPETLRLLRIDGHRSKEKIGVTENESTCSN